MKRIRCVTSSIVSVAGVINDWTSFGAERSRRHCLPVRSALNRPLKGHNGYRFEIRDRSRTANAQALTILVRIHP